MKPILGFVEDPGAANMVVGLAEALHHRGLTFHLSATGKAVETLRARHEPFFEPVAESSLSRYAMVVVGTSENLDTQGLRLVHLARDAGIRSVGLVDFFANAAFRFRGRAAEALAFAPDSILVPDELTATEFIGLGHPEADVVTVGHPQYDYVIARERELEAEGRVAVRRRVFPAEWQSLKVAIFLSEISGGLGDSQFQRSDEYTLRGQPERSGRTEVVLDEILPQVAPWRDKWRFAARPHPHNSPIERAEMRTLFDGVLEGGAPLDVVYAADAVFGMTTMLLQEAAIMGRPTLSVVPRPQESKWLPSVLAGVTPCVWSREELVPALAHLFTAPGARFPVAPGSLERLANTVARLAMAESCRN